MTAAQILPWIPVGVPIFLMIALPALPWLFGARQDPALRNQDKH